MDKLDIDRDLKKQNWDIKYNDTGIFTYNALGFDVDLKDGRHTVKWTDIERLEAYKGDLMTTDEICIDITFDNKRIIVTEETKGWYQFIDKLKIELPLTIDNWEASVLEPPFKHNLTTIYERADRKMPSKTNFYSIIKCKTKEDLSDIFQKHGWTIRKSSKNNYEFENSWTDLVVDSDNDGLLLHGLVAYHPDNVKIIKQIFDDLNCSYKFEFYGDNNEILEQTQNGM